MMNEDQAEEIIMAEEVGMLPRERRGDFVWALLIIGARDLRKTKEIDH